MVHNPAALQKAFDNPTPPTDYLFHPTMAVRDRAEVAKFFETVFGIEGYYQIKVMSDPRLSYRSDYPMDYSYYTWLADCWFDAIEPELLKIEGAKTTPPTMHRLLEMGWLVDDIPTALRACEQYGIRAVNQTGTPVSSDHPEGAISAATTEISLLWLNPDDCGLAVELCYMRPAFSQQFGAVCFPPMINDWRPPAPHGANSLGMEYCAHHTILTTNLERGLNWSVNVLGGRVFHKNDNRALETESTYVWVGKTVLEFAVPRKGSASWAAWQDKTTSLSGIAQEDVYHQITFKVTSLATALKHLQKVGVDVIEDGDIAVLDPKAALGIRWGLTDTVLPGDPRG